MSCPHRTVALALGLVAQLRNQLLYEPRVVGLTGLQSDRLQTQYCPIASVHSTQHLTSGKSRSRDERIRVLRYTQCWGTGNPNSTMSLATNNTSHNPLLKSARCQRVQITQVLKVSRESTRMAQRHINTMTGECPGKMSRRTVRSI